VRYSKAAAAVAGAHAEPEAPERGHFCAAAGCPLSGSIRIAGGWFCGHHFRAEPIEWPRITADIIADKQSGRLNDRGDAIDPPVTPTVAAMRAKVLRVPRFPEA
jgi:hypothetical protein